MANEIQHVHDTTGSTLYAVVYNASGQIWDTTGTPAFETINVTKWQSGDFAISVDEDVASSYLYLGDFPAAITAGQYTVMVYQKLGGQHEPSDTLLGSAKVAWNGSAEVYADTVLSEITEAADIPATPTIREAIMLLYMAVRNANEATDDARSIKNSAGSEVLTAAMSDDGTTFDQGKLGD